MRWFRRSKGRHALGAAVTALPSGPVAATWSPPPWDARTTGAPDPSAPAAPAEPAATVPAAMVPAVMVPAVMVPAVMVPAPVLPVPVLPVPVLPPASVGAAATVPTNQSVLASDVPWAETVAAQESPDAAVEDPRDELFDSIAELIASGEAWAQTPAATLVVPAAVLPVFAVPVQAVPVQAVPVQAVPVQAVPVQAVPVHIPAPEPHGTRVSIGFRDGTTAVLDRDSEQAAALEELAALLSLRD